MVLLILAIIAVLLFFGLVTGVIFVTRVYRTYSRLKSDLSDFFVEQDPEGHTEFSTFISKLMEAGAVRIGQNVRAGIQGSLGGTMKGAVNELENEAISGDPRLGAVKMLPKSIQKNPIAAIGAQFLLDKLFSGSRNPDAGGSGGNGTTWKGDL